MAMGRRKDVQGGFWVATQDLPSSPGHPFYERLNELLDQRGFDHFCESSCEKFYAAKMGRPSVRPADTGRLQVEEVVADKGYHSGQTLADLEEIGLRPYVSEPQRGRRKWTPTDPQEQQFKRAEQAAVYRNRRRSGGARSKRLHRKRVELVERPFDHVPDDGGMRRTHLKGQQKVAKRYLIHTAAFNLGLIMRKVTGFGTPTGWAGRCCASRPGCVQLGIAALYSFEHTG